MVVFGRGIFKRTLQAFTRRGRGESRNLKTRIAGIPVEIPRDYLSKMSYKHCFYCYLLDSIYNVGMRPEDRSSCLNG